MLPYNNIDYCNYTHMVDDIFSYYSDYQHKVVQTLLHNPELLNSAFIPHDKICLSNLTRYHPHIDIISRSMDNTLSHFYICSHCVNINRLVDINDDTLLKPFHIECGKLVGTYMVVQIYKHLHIFMESYNVSKALININPIILGYNTIENIKYIGSDPFSNGILINMYLNHIFDNTNSNHIQKLYMSNICQNNGVRLLEYLGSDIKLKDSIEIIKQLLSTLIMLKEHDFTYGIPNTSSILFSNKPCSYTYDKVRIDSSTTLKICGFDYSSISIGNNTRLYSRLELFDEEISRYHLKNILNLIHVKDGTYMYNLNKTTIIYNSLRHLGYPIFNSSMDLYGFMIVLMLNKTFFTNVLNNEYLLNLWKSMWLIDEYPILMNELSYLDGTYYESERVYNILSKYTLRYDILSYLWNQIKS